MRTINAKGREEVSWPSIGWSFKPNAGGIIEKPLSKDDQAAILMHGAAGVIQFGTDLWAVRGVSLIQTPSEKGRKVNRMKVVGVEIKCRGEIRDGGGVIRVWFDADGKTWEASKINGWLPKVHESNQTLAEPYKPDIDARKCIGMASMFLTRR